MSAMSCSFWLSAGSFCDVPVAYALPPDDGRYQWGLSAAYLEPRRAVGNGSQGTPIENHLFVSGKLSVSTELFSGERPCQY
jgi:hypothetical protein